MNRTLRSVCSLVSLAMFFAIWTADISAQSYTIVDLGTLGGDGSGGDGINELGQVVGWSIDDPYAYYGYISGINGPPLTSLGSPPNGDYSYALAANDLGQVVGFGEVTVGFGEEDHAIFWQNGTMTDLGTFGGGASQALGINNASQVVGWAEDANPGTYAFIWESGSMTELPGFPGAYPETEAYDINDSGVAAGYSIDLTGYRRAVTWENGVMSDGLELPPGAFGSRAYAINNLNEISGSTLEAGNTSNAVVWDSDGNPTILPPTGGHYYNSATGLNDLGQAVGMSYSTVNGDPVLWENGIAFDVEDLTEMEPGIFGLVVSDINNAGQIAATSSGSGGFRAVRLDPVPNSIGLSGPDPGRTNEVNQLAVRGATSGETVYFVIGFAEGSTPIPGCPGLEVGIANARLIGSAVADSHGLAVFTGVAPDVLSGHTVYFQAVEQTSCRVSTITSHSFY